MDEGRGLCGDPQHSIIWTQERVQAKNGLMDPPSPPGLHYKGPQRRSQKRLDRRLEEVAKAAGGGWCRLQMPLELALAIRETVAGHRLGALEGAGCLPPLPMHPCSSPFTGTQPPC